MAANEVHINDVGTQFKLTLKDGDSVVDVSTFTTRQIQFMKPNGDLVTKAASLYTDGTDGIIYYTTTSGDIDQAGTWKMQAILSNNSSKFYSDITSFRVFNNLD